MPRVNFVKKARKDYPNQGIKRGESYYWWKFRYGGMHRSKIRPRPSQLTMSDFLSTMYSIQEEIEDMSPDDFETGDDLQSFIEEKADEIRNLGEEQSDKLSNMPDSLQEGSTGEMLQNRADSCEDMASELEGIDATIDSELSAEEKEERKQEIIEEIQGVSYDGE